MCFFDLHQVCCNWICLSTVKSSQTLLVSIVTRAANLTAVPIILTRSAKTPLHLFWSHSLRPTIPSSGRTWSRAPPTAAPSSHWSNCLDSRAPLSTNTSTSTSQQSKRALRSRIAATGLNLGKSSLPFFVAHYCDFHLGALVDRENPWTCCAAIIITSFLLLSYDLLICAGV